MARTVRLTAFCSYNDSCKVSVSRVRGGRVTRLEPGFMSVAELIVVQFGSRRGSLHIPRGAAW